MMTNDYSGTTTLNGPVLADWLGGSIPSSDEALPDGIAQTLDAHGLTLEILHPKRSLGFYFAGVTACSFMLVFGLALGLHHLLGQGDATEAMRAGQWFVAGLAGQALMTWLAFEDWRTPQSLVVKGPRGKLSLTGSRLLQAVDLNGFADVHCRPGGRLRLAGAAGGLTILKGLSRSEQRHLQTLLREILANGRLHRD